MAACGEGAVDVARLLLAAGADPNQANSVRHLRACLNRPRTDY